MQRITMAIMVAAAFGDTVPALAQEKSGADVARVVSSVMDETYGAASFDAKNACWTYSWKDDQGDTAVYCMRAGKPHVTQGPGGEMLYFPTFSVAGMSGNETYRYAHVQPGLMGAFKVRLGGTQGWTYQAFDAGMDYGSAGDCGCESPRFVKLSNHDDYGWMFTSGGTWQDTTVASYSIVTAIKGRIVDVSKIPRVTEDAQDVTYAVSVKEEASARGFYPLHVVRTSAGGKVDTFDVPFDTTKSVYALPAGR
jgi:hypothetical protein